MNLFYLAMKSAKFAAWGHGAKVEPVMARGMIKVTVRGKSAIVHYRDLDKIHDIAFDAGCDCRRCNMRRIATWTY